MLNVGHGIGYDPHPLHHVPRNALCLVFPSHLSGDHESSTACRATVLGTPAKDFGIGSHNRQQAATQHQV